MDKKKRWTVIAGSVVCALILAFLIAYGLLAWNRDIAVVKISDASALTAKLKTAVTGNGNIELGEPDMNAVISEYFKGSKYKNKIKDPFIKLSGNDAILSAVVPFWNKDFFVQCRMNIAVAGGSIRLKIQKLSIGKIMIPKGIALNLIKKNLGKNVKILDDGSIDIGSRILMFDIKDIRLASGSINLTLATQLASKEGAQQNKGGNVQNGSQPASGGEAKPAVDPKIAALKTTNKELRLVLGDVTNSQAKSWVLSVIAINSKMISNPSENFSGEISNAKGAFGRFSSDAKDEIRSAAMNNMDMATIRYLAKTYGL
ncbi:MAG: hypothetical protein QME45_07765 [Clostridiales bacterium]|nr:hypothetical protein [Clostridiales bacterium]